MTYLWMFFFSKDRWECHITAILRNSPTLNSLIDFRPLHFRTILVILTKLSIISKRLRSSYVTSIEYFIHWKFSGLVLLKYLEVVMNISILKYTFYELKQRKKTIWPMDLSTFISFCHTSFIFFVLSFCLFG